jgi:Ser/Thr protein kinase RdoA (MazF antagonist)
MDLARRVAKLVGATSTREILGGHQSRVFEVARSGRRMVVKVHDASTVDKVTLNTRVETIAMLAVIDEQVCGPVPLEGRLVTTFEGGDGRVGLVTCYEFAEGDAPDAASLVDATLMGNCLARLHRSMRRIGQQALPLVAALDTVRPDWDGHPQLLHGDFNAGNLRIADGVARIFDFDDCGYGPPTFDVANALYMVLFDELTGRRSSVYRSFAEAFLTGYCAVTRQPLDTDDVSRFIDLRVTALQSWLDEPDTAPIGIRSSPPSWHATLRSFVRDYQNQRH